MDATASDGFDGIGSNVDPISATGGHGAMLRTTRWLDLGSDDPRVPPALLIAFSAAAFTPSAFEQHDVVLPAVLRRAVPKRQAEFLMGRLAARRAIERLGIAASTPGIGASREPLWQAGVTGSITHVNDMAAAIAVVSSTATGLGLDIEKVFDADARDAVRELAITSDEQTLLERRRGHLSADMALTIAFSAKESFFKGTFATVGRYFDFGAATVSDLNADAGRVTLTLEESLCPGLAEGRSFAAFFKLLSADAVATGFVW